MVKKKALVYETIHQLTLKAGRVSNKCINMQVAFNAGAVLLFKCLETQQLNTGVIVVLQTYNISNQTGN